jgi:hypothetical protein
MMIHVENTPVACRTVMAAFWLENIAHKAIPPSFVLWIS